MLNNHQSLAPTNPVNIFKNHFDCAKLQECIGQSFIGITNEPSCPELKKYLDDMSTIYMACAITHIALGIIVVIVIFISLIRKHHFSCFQWTLLTMTLASSVVSSYNSIEFGKSYNFACEFANSLETGIAMIMYF